MCITRYSFYRQISILNVKNADIESSWISKFHLKSFKINLLQSQIWECSNRLVSSSYCKLLQQLKVLQGDTSNSVQPIQPPFLWQQSVRLGRRQESWQPHLWLLGPNKSRERSHFSKLEDFKFKKRIGTMFRNLRVRIVYLC